MTSPTNGADDSGRHGRRRAGLAIAAVAMAVEVAAVASRGYRLGGNVAVRCRSGHVFTTLWIPGVSVKALRLGFWRLQRCPVGRHWSLVTPVRRDDLGRSDRRSADRAHDLPIP